ncbi:hypothetical protein [Subtercola boreus]|uniref:hypothetical protein n=1 Tax=Subtercola boreus TaxID=120213 RepID=UPI0011C04521|nr:hypothetical protein [Subtercola boreus]
MLGGASAAGRAARAGTAPDARQGLRGGPRRAGGYGTGCSAGPPRRAAPRGRVRLRMLGGASAAGQTGMMNGTMLR